MEDPITALRVPLAVECKQYRKADNRKFAEAVTDYARGHPSGTVILVNYSPVREEAVYQRVDSDLRGRIRTIGDLNPAHLEQLDAFRTAVRHALGIEDPQPAESAADGAAQSEGREDFAAVGTIELRWGAVPTDLDLHLVVPSMSGRDEVSWQSKGEGKDPPYCQLDRDVTTGYGPERIRIFRWLPGTYEVIVRGYSEDAPLRESAARILVATASQTREFECPTDLDGQVWNVCTIDGATGDILELPAP